jgi:predicted dehydrogenase
VIPACSPSARRPRLALLGCGRIGQEVYLPLLGRRQDVELTVVADEASDARARASRAAPKGTATVSDWRDALIRDDVDAAIIALPPALHSEAACAALTRGLHVYVEKPLATSDAGARAILGAQGSTTSFAMIGFNYRFNPLYSELRARIHNGEVGRVRIVRTIFSAPESQRTGWRGSRQAGGGVLLELGSHHVDLVRWLTRVEVRGVQCHVAEPQRGSECVTLQLALERDIAAQIVVAMGTVAEDRVEVFGEGGAISVDRYRSVAPMARGPAVPGRLQSLANSVRAVRRLPYLLSKRGSPWHEPSHEAALDRFVDGINGRPGDAPTLADGWASLRVILAAEASDATGRAVAMDDQAHAPDPF